MAAPILMPTDTQILTLTQWLSPAFPVGSFAYSHGLEGAAGMGWVKDGAGLEAWLEDVLLHGAGRADSLLLAAAFHAGTSRRLGEIDRAARAFAASAERRLETEAQGLAFGRALAAWDVAPKELTFPVALGAAAAQESLPLALTQKLYLHAFLSNLVAVGQRLLAVGQQQGQAMLRRLTLLCPEVARDTRDGDLSKLASAAFLTDIASMRHESQNSRIFRT